MSNKLYLCIALNLVLLMKHNPWISFNQKKPESRKGLKQLFTVCFYKGGPMANAFLLYHIVLVNRCMDAITTSSFTSKIWSNS